MWRLTVCPHHPVTSTPARPLCWRASRAYCFGCTSLTSSPVQPAQPLQLRSSRWRIATCGWTARAPAQSRLAPFPCSGSPAKSLLISIQTHKLASLSSPLLGSGAPPFLRISGYHLLQAPCARVSSFCAETSTRLRPRCALTVSAALISKGTPPLDRPLRSSR
jgi:hypothetical protein